MEEKDLKQIREVVREEVKSGFQEEFPKAFQSSFAEEFPKAFTESFGQVWEDNLEPAFDALHDRLQVIEAKLDRALYTELIHLEARITRLEEKTGIKRN